MVVCFCFGLCILLLVSLYCLLGLFDLGVFMVGFLLVV